VDLASCREIARRNLPASGGWNLQAGHHEAGAIGVRLTSGYEGWPASVYPVRPYHLSRAVKPPGHNSHLWIAFRLSEMEVLAEIGQLGAITMEHSARGHQDPKSRGSEQEPAIVSLVIVKLWRRNKRGQVLW
jgi:hypothetical protein